MGIDTTRTTVYARGMEEPTTVKIDRETRERLERRKVHPRQPVGEIIREVLDELEAREREAKSA